MGVGVVRERDVQDVRERASVDDAGWSMDVQTVGAPCCHISGRTSRCGCCVSHSFDSPTYCQWMAAGSKSVEFSSRALDLHLDLASPASQASEDNSGILCTEDSTWGLDPLMGPVCWEFSTCELGRVRVHFR